MGFCVEQGQIFLTVNERRAPIRPYARYQCTPSTEFCNKVVQLLPMVTEIAFTKSLQLTTPDGVLDVSVEAQNLGADFSLQLVGSEFTTEFAVANGVQMRLTEFRIVFGPLMSLGVDFGERTDNSWRIFRQGYQSWNGAESLSVNRDTQTYSFLSKLGISWMMQDTDSPLWGQNTGVPSSTMVLFQPAWTKEEIDRSRTDLNFQPHRRCMLIGAVASEVCTTEYLSTSNDDGLLVVEMIQDYDSKPVGTSVAGSANTMKGDKLVMLIGFHTHALIDWYSKLCAKIPPVIGQRSNLVCNFRAPVGWGSWYHFYTTVSEEKMLEVIDIMKREPFDRVCDFIQLDDGYQKELGDWTETNSKFPRGLAPLAANIQDSGKIAGIWLAPFIAGRASKLYREHPTWFVRDTKTGKHLVAHFNPDWGLRKNAVTYCLDLSHPDALEWLFNTFRTLVKFGYTMFKIDFLAAGMRRGLRYNQTITRVEAFVAGLQVIRRAIGPNSFLLGCGAPLAGCWGSAICENDQETPIFDSMRVSKDTAERWDEPWVARKFAHDWPAPCVRGALLGNIGRWYMHGRCWAFNDPDCLIVRKNNTSLNLKQVITQITIIGMTGGMLMLTDDMTKLAQDRLLLAMQILPPSPIRGWPASFMQEGRPSTYVAISGDRVAESHSRYLQNAKASYKNPDEKHKQGQGRGGVIAFTNWEDSTPRSFRLPHAIFEPVEIYDSWHGNQNSNLPNYSYRNLVSHLAVEDDARPFAVFDFWRQAIVALFEPIPKKLPSGEVIQPKFKGVEGMIANSGRSMFANVMAGGTSPDTIVPQTMLRSLTRPLDITLEPHETCAVQVMPFTSSHPSLIGTSFHLMAMADGRVVGNSTETSLVIEGGADLALTTGYMWVLFPKTLDFATAKVMDKLNCDAQLLVTSEIPMMGGMRCAKVKVTWDQVAAVALSKTVPDGMSKTSWRFKLQF